MPRRFAPRNDKRRLKGNHDCLAKNYELKTIYLQLVPAVGDVIANHCWRRKNEYLIHVGLIIEK